MKLSNKNKTSISLKHVTQVWIGNDDVQNLRLDVVFDFRSSHWDYTYENLEDMQTDMQRISNYINGQDQL